MRTDEIRERFLKFFESKSHTIVPSDSLVPAKDPSILFTGAGMNQFKEQFMGLNLEFRRAATSQKCLRTADLENVGRTSSHHTFFEMLGNFSFGDYFKKEAISWAWEFLTLELKIPKEKLSVSVYMEDDEAYGIWQNDMKVPKERILRLGDKDNFWPSEARKNGPNGPCGPCSEIFYDRGDKDPTEIWNLVFTQFERKDGGALANLPSRNIDTGMGLERLASVMQGVRTNFEIDIFAPIIKAIKGELPPEPRAQSSEPNINAIADHIRAISFAIADGVYPSNEERGFVIRKLIRKSTQRALQIKPGCGPFLYRVVPSVAEAMKAAFPELVTKRETISQIVKSEEERFHAILLEIVPVLEEEFEGIKRAGAKKVPGEIIFRYSDEKGVPLDLQKEIAQEAGIALDMDGFNKFLEGQKERSRAKSKISKDIFAAPSGLLRREKEWDEESKIKISMNHTATHLLHAALRKVLGGHVWQSGSLVYPERLRFDFTHPKKLDKEEIRKIEELVNNAINSGFEVKREVMTLDEAKKQGAIALFGEKYGQQITVRTIGDFSKELCSGDHIDNTQKIRILKIVQEASIAAGTRRIEAVTGDEVYEWLINHAKKLKDPVLEWLNQSGQFKNLEKSDKDLIAHSQHAILNLDSWLGSKNKETLTYEDIKQWLALEEGFKNLTDALDGLKKKMARQTEKQKEQDAVGMIDELIKNSKKAGGIDVIASLLKDMDAAMLRVLTDKITGKAPGAVVLLAGSFGDKVSLVLAVGNEAAKKGLKANELIKPVAACVGGSGGGRPELAQAGGKDTGRIAEALQLIYKLVEERASK